MAGVTFGQLPEEEAAFLAYLQTTGEVWARAVRDDPMVPKFEPLPVVDFLKRHAGEIVAYSSVDVYLGTRDDILHPEVSIQEVIEGGTAVPFQQDSKIVEGVRTIVGGTKVLKKFIDPRGSRLVRYNRGEYRSQDELASSNLGFQPGTFNGQTWIAHPQSFMKWGKKILDWMRRHTPESVPVFECNYEIRATTRVAQACKKGLKLR
jgi:hypothetical protein